jgi:hypothetical protein
MDPVIYMVLVALTGMALTLGVAWIVAKFFRR